MGGSLASSCSSSSCRPASSSFLAWPDDGRTWDLRAAEQDHDRTNPHHEAAGWRVDDGKPGFGLTDPLTCGFADQALTRTVVHGCM